MNLFRYSNPWLLDRPPPGVGGVVVAWGKQATQPPTPVGSIFPSIMEKPGLVTQRGMFILAVAVVAQILSHRPLFFTDINDDVQGETSLSSFVGCRLCSNLGRVVGVRGLDCAMLTHSCCAVLFLISLCSRCMLSGFEAKSNPT